LYVFSTFLCDLKKHIRCPQNCTKELSANVRSDKLSANVRSDKLSDNVAQ